MGTSECRREGLRRPLRTTPLQEAASLPPLIVSLVRVGSSTRGGLVIVVASLRGVHGAGEPASTLLAVSLLQLMSSVGAADGQAAGENRFAAAPKLSPPSLKSSSSVCSPTMLSNSLLILTNLNGISSMCSG